MGNVFGDRDDVADLLFSLNNVPFAGENLPGLGMSIVRYNLGACSPNTVDGKTMAVSKIILPYRQMEGLWVDNKSEDPNSASWDWSRDRKQLQMMLKAKDRGADRFELFSNSPMWWMCANQNPSGAAKGFDDNLRTDQERKFAVYLATVVDQFQKRHGINFTTVEPFNEPLTNYWYADCKQEGCHFSLESQMRFLPLLRQELDRRGLKDTPIAASDETAFDHAFIAWTKYDAKSKALVDQVNVHGYQGKSGNRQGLFEITRGKRLWNSEHGEGDASGSELVHGITLDIANLRPTAWCYWQPFDGGGWGLIDADMVRGKERRVNRKYFALAQYSRHIRPGMTLLTTGDPEVVAAMDQARHRLVIVVANGAQPQRKILDISAFGTIRPFAKRWMTELKGRANYQRLPDLEVNSHKLEVDLPSDSVQTFELINVRS